LAREEESSSDRWQGQQTLPQQTTWPPLPPQLPPPADDDVPINPASIYTQLFFLISISAQLFTRLLYYITSTIP